MWVRAGLVVVLVCGLLGGCGDDAGGGNQGNSANSGNAGNDGNAGNTAEPINILGDLAPGMSWLTKTVNTVTAGGDTVRSVTYTRYEVTSTDDGRCLYTLSKLDAQKNVTQSFEESFPKTISGSAASDPVRPKISDDKVDAAGHSFQCKKIATENSTLWSSQQYPLVTVKASLTARGMSSVTTLEEFHAP